MKTIALKKSISLKLALLVLSLQLRAQVSFTLINAVCHGSTQTLVANAGSAALLGCSWSVFPTGPAFSSASSFSTQVSFPTPGVFTITLMAQLSSGTATAFNFVQVFADPVITSSQSSQTTCIVNTYPKYSKPVTITLSGANTYSVAPNVPNGAWGQTNPFTVISPVSTCYTIQGSNIACTSSINVCVTVIPQFSFAISPSVAIICTADSLEMKIVDIQPTAAGPASAYTYSWTESASMYNTLSTVFSPTVKASPPGNTTYTAEVRDANACVSSAQMITISVTSCTGEFEIGQSKNVLRVYPNPANDFLNVDFDLPAFEKINFSLTNLLGEVVYSSDTVSVIDLRFLRSGIYYLKTIYNGQQQPVKVVKE